MLNFTHSIPTTIYFGKGQIKAIGPELKNHATKILIVTGQGSVKKNGIFNEVIKEIQKAKVQYAELSGIMPNPRLESVYKGIEICRKEDVDFVLAVGGGSVIDAAKAIACGVEYKKDVWDFFIKKAQVTEALPVGTVLTLAATGSEMNGNSVITKEEGKRKLAVGSRFLRPVFSVLDPTYTYTVNKYHTSAGVVDIMVHVFEQYFSHTPNADVQDRIAESLLKVCIKYGPVACENPKNYNTRANILWAGSLALNDLIGEGKEEDWASHAIEHELSAVYDISHGAGLAIIAPNWMRHVLSEKTVDKFAEYGVNVWNVEKNRPKMKIASEAINKTREFFNILGMPSNLSEALNGDRSRHDTIPYDETCPHTLFEGMAKNAMKDWKKVGSFKKLTEKDIIDILKASL